MDIKQNKITSVNFNDEQQKDEIIVMLQSEIEQLLNSNNKKDMEIKLLQQRNNIYKNINFLAVILSCIAVILGSSSFWLVMK